MLSTLYITLVMSHQKVVSQGMKRKHDDTTKKLKDINNFTKSEHSAKKEKKEENVKQMEKKKNISKKELKEKEEKKRVDDAMAEVEEVATSTQQTPMEKFLRAFIATRFQEYLDNSIISRVSDTIEGIIVDEFERQMTDMVIRCATPQHGIIFSLKTYLGAIDTLANEALCVIADRYEYGRKLKKKTKIELRFETAPIQIFRRFEQDNILLRDDTRVGNDRDLLAFFNDKNLSYFSGYKNSGKKNVNLYSAYLNNVLITSMIIPYEPLNYHIVNTDNSAISSQSLMQDRYKKNFMALKERETQLLETQKLLTVANAKLKENDAYIKKLITANTSLTGLNKTLQDELDERSL